MNMITCKCKASYTLCRRNSKTDSFIPVPLLGVPFAQIRQENRELSKMLFSGVNDNHVISLP